MRNFLLMLTIGFSVSQFACNTSNQKSNKINTRPTFESIKLEEEIDTVEVKSKQLKFEGGVIYKASEENKTFILRIKQFSEKKVLCHFSVTNDDSIVHLQQDTLTRDTNSFGKYTGDFGFSCKGPLFTKVSTKEKITLVLDQDSAYHAGYHLTNEEFNKKAWGTNYLKEKLSVNKIPLMVRKGAKEPFKLYLHGILDSEEKLRIFNSRTSDGYIKNVNFFE